MVDADLTSPDAKVITLDYRTAAIPDADKKLLAYVKKVTLHAQKTPTPMWMGSRDMGYLKGRSSKRFELRGCSATSIVRVRLRR